MTAAPPEIPAALIEQLAVGGRLVVPVGTDQAQLLKAIDRTEDGLTETILEAVHFVPLVNGLPTIKSAQADTNGRAATRSGGVRWFK